MVTVLIGDIGGTNSRFCIYNLPRVFELNRGSRAPGMKHFSKKYTNFGHATFTEIIELFLKESGLKSPPAACCLAVAGPVQDNRVVMTNRSWIIDGNELSERLKIKKFVLINDFVSNAYGLLTLNDETECIAVQDALPSPSAPIACVGAGTGLGECFMTPSKTLYEAWPSEGGHTEFAPRSELDLELCKFIQSKFSITEDRISIERVVSGPGLACVYEFLEQKFPDEVNKEIHDAFESAGDFKAAIVTENYATNTLCKKALDLFLYHYGSEVGSACLKWLPFGGMYIAGGIALKILDILMRGGDFMRGFHSKGRLSQVLEKVCD